ncbi:hypothetical protein ET495_16765 [Xylanimonas allomyrinae]|uniref:Uncharacterized protein n=1 Tax=Xylanimonas allomyrinae TaxID=2509459 RepID=A0A4P6EPT4_9MICO|nr:hypothetical protein ET495_16765 [Xylanimonas allomyrinae]
MLRNLDDARGAPGFVRFESPTPNSRGRHVGVFGLANRLAHDGALAPDDWAWWRHSNDWCNAAYPDPSTVDPQVYDHAVNPGATAWFRPSAVHLIDKTREYLDLLDRYGVPWTERRSAAPGRVVYADDGQVVVVPGESDD